MDISRIIRRFRGRKVLVLGDLILDRYLFGDVRRISPEAPVPVVEVADENFLLGGAANVAHNIVALGGQVSVAGIIGRDRAGAVLKDLLEERNIGTSGIFDDSRVTTVKTRLIAHRQQVVRFDREDRKRLEGRLLADMTAYLSAAVKAHDAVIVSDYKKGVITASLMKSLVDLARAHDTFIAVDPKVGHFHLYRHVSLVTPNIAEASQGSGVEITDERSLLRAGTTLLQRLSCRSVLITRGDEGMSLFERPHASTAPRVVHIPTVAKKVFDVTGAGDTVIAAFTLAHAAGATLEGAARIANYAAGIVVGEIGTAVVTPQRLLVSLRAETGGRHKRG
jgi:D-beta-D-heptose 7-phosphate kinase/D-beta-D-heptose 1-phosphate adenosyltransferase